MLASGTGNGEPVNLIGLEKFIFPSPVRVAGY